MCKKFISLLPTLFAVLNIVNSDPALSITKCHSSDSECLKQNALTNAELFSKGLPEYNVEPLDPITFKSIDCSSQNLKLIFTDAVLKGFKKCTINKLARDTQKSTLVVDLLCDITANGKYEIDGKLLLLPIQGKGDVHADIRKVHISGEANMETYTGKDGKQHWKVTTWTHKFELQGKSKLKFDNLFNGNAALSKTVQSVIDNNANEVVEEIAGPVVTALISKVAKNISSFWKYFAIEDLSLNN